MRNLCMRTEQWVASFAGAPQIRMNTAGAFMLLGIGSVGSWDAEWALWLEHTPG